MKIHRLFASVLAGAALLTGCARHSTPQQKANDEQESGWTDTVSPLKMASSGVDSVPVSEEMQKIPYVQDAMQLISQVEMWHPWFLLEEDSKSYERKRAQFLEEAARSGNDSDLPAFQAACGRYLSQFHDLHTSLLLRDDRRIESLLEEKDGKIWVPSLRQDVWLSGISDETTTCSTEDLMRLADEICSHESEYGAKRNRERFLGTAEFLEMAGLKPDQSVVLHFSDGSSEATAMKIQLQTDPDRLSGCRIEGDTALISYPSCSDQIVDQMILPFLQECAEQKIKKYVFDVRDNSGGDSSCNERIYEALGLQVASSRRVDLRCPDPELQNPVVCSPEGLLTMTRSDSLLQKARQANLQNDIPKIAVLVSEDTFSSAVMFASELQDSQCARIIGTPPLNAPSSYGDVSSVFLPNSTLNFGLSRKRFYRADPKSRQDLLEPDDWCTDEEALDHAISWLQDETV